MKRGLGLILALALCAGCRSAQPVSDPFLGPTVVPPPGTATPPPGQPYYGTPAGAPPISAPPPAETTVPALPRGGVPLNFNPAPAGGMSSFTPNVSPVGPVYGPPGGTGYPSYPQAAMTPQYGTPTLAQSSLAGTPIASNPMAAPGMSPTATSAPTISGTPPGAVTPATHWAPAGQNAAMQTASAGNQNSTVTSPTLSPTSPNQIRIVEPSAATAPPNFANATAPGLFQPAGSMSALPSGSASSATLNQSLSNPPGSAATIVRPSATISRIPDISELPVVPTYGTSGFTPATASTANTLTPTIGQRPSTAQPFVTPPSPPAATTVSPASSASTAIPVANYGYDSQYRWLKGKLEYSQSTRTWRLRYIPPDGVSDNYGGSVVLPDASKLANFQPGDLVYVQGTPGAPTANQGSFAPLYNLAQIQKQ